MRKRNIHVYSFDKEKTIWLPRTLRSLFEPKFPNLWSEHRRNFASVGVWHWRFETFGHLNTMFSRWRESTVYMKIAFVSFILGFILYVIGFSTLYWECLQTTESSTKVIGLWKYLLEYRYTNQVQEAKSYISIAQIPKYVFNSGE